MLAGGGTYNGVRLLSPRTIDLMRSDHMQGIDVSFLDAMVGLAKFGLGVGITTGTGELSAPGAYGWGGAAGTYYWVDPVNDIVGLFMNQSIPNRTGLGPKFQVMTYQALVD